MLRLISVGLRYLMDQQISAVTIKQQVVAAEIPQKAFLTQPDDFCLNNGAAFNEKGRSASASINSIAEAIPSACCERSTHSTEMLAVTGY
ncbi:hypothetical protein AK51_06830 [Serratia nematodiphila DZ0503SBS1]|nr:hypothetical protein AK51_06830 [Serratia nematodiphila DZ0503SBS1]